MPVCQVCQKDNPQGVEYCEDCGAALTPAREPVPAVAATTTPSGASGEAPQPAAPTADGSQAPPAGGQQATDGAAAPSPVGAAESGVGTVAAAPEPSPAAPTPASGSVGPRLLVKRFGTVTEEQIPLQGERLLVGRFDPETGPVDIDLSNLPGSEHISRQHAELYRETEGRWFVRDLGSTNGVFVRGSGDASFGPRITEPHGLTEGDEVSFGNSRFVFRTE